MGSDSTLQSARFVASLTWLPSRLGSLPYFRTLRRRRLAAHLLRSLRLQLHLVVPERRQLLLQLRRHGGQWARHQRGSWKLRDARWGERVCPLRWAAAGAAGKRGLR
jgi:hypothetical protein